MDFKTFKKNATNIDALADKIAKINSPTREEYGTKDDRFWYPEVDKAGNGYAVIRFLPGPSIDGEDSAPFVKYFSHGFEAPSGKWYIENSLTSITKNDPIGELNTRLWNTKVEEYIAIARKQKRKLSYISNIMVISDSKNPENEGKIKLYRYGKKIFDRIFEAMFPLLPDEPKMNPFDFWTGANFKLSIRQVAGYRNYDLSKFDSPSKLSESDDELEKIWNNSYSLQHFVAPDKFKTYEELKVILDKAIGCDSSSDDVFSVLTGTHKQRPVNVTKASNKKEEMDEDIADIPFDDGDDVSYFQNLARKG